MTQYKLNDKDVSPGMFALGCLAILGFMGLYLAGVAALFTGLWNYVVVPLGASLGATVTTIDWPLGLGLAILIWVVGSFFRRNGRG